MCFSLLQNTIKEIKQKNDIKNLWRPKYVRRAIFRNVEVRVKGLQLLFHSTIFSEKNHYFPKELRKIIFGRHDQFLRELNVGRQK